MLQSAQLIGRSTDDESLYNYSTNLLLMYIKEELIFLPNSMRKTDMFIPLVQKLLDDIIMRNEFSANEHPHMLAALQSSLTHKFNEFWRDNMCKQLQSIYKDVQNMQGIPPREEVERVTHYNHCDWNPTRIITQYDQQIDESYQEQVFAINVFKSTIDRYINPPSIDGTSMTHTKGVIIHGGPGTGKTYVAKLAVLYAICSGMKIISTSILGIRASDLGGTHLHSLFCWTPQKHESTPSKTALSALNRILRKPLLRHTILALDALFIDEIGTLSNKQLAVLDIMFQKCYNSPLPFGGLLILGSLDPCRIGVIKAMPLLMSTSILTWFQAVKLCHLVRAFHDPEYQELLNIMQTNPLNLIDYEEKNQDSMNWSTCFGLSRHGTTPPLHPTWLGFLQRRFQWQHLSKFTPMQSLLDLLLTVLCISYAFLVIVREAPVPSASTCQPVPKPKRPSTKISGHQRSLFFINMVFMNVPWMIHGVVVSSPVWLYSWNCLKGIPSNPSCPLLCGLLLLGPLTWISWVFIMANQRQISLMTWSGFRSRLDVHLSRLLSFVAGLMLSACSMHWNIEVHWPSTKPRGTQFSMLPLCWKKPQLQPCCSPNLPL